MTTARQSHWIDHGSTRAAVMLAILVLVHTVATATGGSLSKPELLNLRFEQKPGGQVPLDLMFTNDAETPVQLRDYFGRRPAILVLGYYECPMLCSLVLNGLVESLQDMRATAGQDFDLLFASIDPRETPALAAAKKRAYLKRYGRPNAERGWHFLVGGEPAIESLANAVGFHFAYDGSLKQYAHPSGIIVVTPEGKVAQYFFGVRYPAGELNKALRAAGAHRVGSPVQELLLLCFQHVPLMGKYSAAIMVVLRAFSMVVIVGIVGYVLLAIRREQGRPHQPSPSAADRVQS